MTQAQTSFERSRRRADGSAAASSRGLDGHGNEVPGAEPAEFNLRALWPSAKAWLANHTGTHNADIRVALALPLLEQSASLLLGHVATVVLATLAYVASRHAWALWLVGADVVLLVARLIHLHMAARLRARIGARATLISMPTYRVLGITWSVVNGVMVAHSLFDPAIHPYSIVFLTTTLGMSAGIAARCAGTPLYALTQILCWTLPYTVDLALGGAADRVMVLAIITWWIALVSIVWRLYGDLFSMICVQRRSAAVAGRFNAALSNMSQGLIVYDAEGTLRVINRRFFKLFGLPPDTLAEGDRAEDVARACQEAGLLGSQAAAALDFGAPGKGGAPTILELADGRAMALSGERMPDGGMITTFEDITERRANEARIAHMALHDGLTNMPNRLLFRDRLDQSVARLGRGEGFAIACLDLDHFKEVNDTLGHNMGDRLLQEVATRLTCCVREVDLVARLGGDEFAVLLPGIYETGEAHGVARRLIDTISGSYEFDGTSMVIGVSIGIAMAPRDGTTAEALLMHADLAMYAAKADGRGGARLFERDLSTRLAARQDLERDFRLALERDEFVMHYQPIVSVAEGRVTGMEALCRWHHPQRGLVNPDQFIPFAEESGLIVPLGNWVLETACRQAAEWPEPVNVAINLSPVQFRNGNLLEAVLGALDRSGLLPCRLEVEITEAAILRETDVTLAALRHLRALGVRVAFDDFGTGFSSLSYLHRFVFDKIKIDKSFIHDLGASESATAIVRAITGLGANLNLVTTAEGVETVSQLAQLRQLGCSEVQGFLFSEPRPNNEVGLLLGNQSMVSRLFQAA
jgi:diguanylate cyclase (GGDEF)-like protein